MGRGGSFLIIARSHRQWKPPCRPCGRNTAAGDFTAACAAAV